MLFERRVTESVAVSDSAEWSLKRGLEEIIIGTSQIMSWKNLCMTEKELLVSGRGKRLREQ
jgi:hypothetical protein